MAVDDSRCAASCANARCACAPTRAPALTAVVTTGGLRLVATGPGVLRLAPSRAARAALARADLRGPTSGGFGATWDDALYHELAEARLGQSARGADGRWRLGVSVTPRVISSATGPTPELWRLQAPLGPRVAALLMGAGFVATGRGEW
jgi:hypothetical protein